MNTKVIAFLARAGSGKTTAAEYLVKHHDAVRVSFAGPLKELARHLWDFKDSQLYGADKETRDWRLQHLGKANATPRSMLQLLGNKAREIIGPTVWIDAAMTSIRKHEGRLIVIDDCRYVNEAKFISSLCARSDLPIDGHVVKIISPDRTSSADPNHPSEAQVDEVPDSCLSSIIVNTQSDGLGAFETALKETVAEILGTFPGKLRG